MIKKVSLKDIAQKIGVSTALVSYVLNNRRENRISKDLAQKIRDAAKAMNYRTNQIAKSLKTNKTLTIGLLIADISNNFDSSLARIIEDEAELHNYTVIFGSSDEDAQKSSKLIDVLINRQVDGLIVFPAAHTEDQVRVLQEQGIPLVLIDRYFPSLNSSYVALDNHHASAIAVNHLAERGYKRIGLINYHAELFHMQERKRGYITAIEEHGLDSNQNLIQEVSNACSKIEVEKAIDNLLALPEPPTALLFTSNTIAVPGLKYINKLGIKVPEQMAIVTFDETEALDMFYAPLTYIKQPLKEMGQLATKILLESISDTAKISQVNMKAELVVRASA